MKRIFLVPFFSLCCFTLTVSGLWGADYYVTQASEPGTSDGCGTCTTPGNNCCTFLDAINLANSNSGSTIHIEVPTVTYLGAVTSPCFLSGVITIQSEVGGSVIDFNGQTSSCSPAAVFQPTGSLTITNTVFKNSNTGGSFIDVPGASVTINGTSINSGADLFINNTFDVYINSTEPSLTFGPTGDYTQPFPCDLEFPVTSTLGITNNYTGTVTLTGDIEPSGGGATASLTASCPNGGIVSLGGQLTLNTLNVDSSNPTIYLTGNSNNIATINITTPSNLYISSSDNIGSSSVINLQNATLNFTQNMTLASGINIKLVGGFDNYINDNGNDVQIDGVVFATGNNHFYIKQGSGIQTLTNTANNSSWNGGVQIFGGVFSIESRNQYSSGGAVTLQGGTFYVSGDVTLGFGRFMTVTSPGGGLAAAAGKTFTVQQALTGSGTLTIGCPISSLNASGTVLLQTASGFSGPIFVGALDGSNNSYPATLSITSFASSIGTPSSLTLQGGGTLVTTGSFSTSTTAIAVGTGSGTFSPGPGFTLTIPSSISVAGGTVGPVTLSIGGGGTVILSGNNSSFAGNMSVISSSTLSVGATNNLGADSSSYSLSLNTGTLAVTGNTTSARGLSLTGANTIALGSNSLSFTGTATVASSSSLTKTGTGTFSILPSSAGTGNPFTLSVTAGEVISNTNFLNGASITIAGGSSIEFDQTTPGTFSGSITGSGAVSITGSDLLTFNPATHSYSGGTSLSGPVSISGDVLGSSGSTLTSNDGMVEIGSSFSLTNQITLTGNLTIDVTSPILLQLTGDISGAGSLIKTGAGTLLLTGSTNNYSGGTTINAGNLEVGAAGKLGTSTVTINGGVLEAAGTFTDTNVVSLAASNGTIQVDSGTYTLSGEIEGPGSLTKTGSGTLELTEVESYTGDTIVSEGTLALSGSGSIISSPAVLVSSGAVIDVSGETDGATLNDLSGAGNIEIGSKILTVHETLDETFSGIISGPFGTLIKTGPATLVLSGVSTYTGKTYVNEGTLEVNGDISSSPDPIVAVGATLSGEGSVGSTIVEALGTLAGGNPLGTLTIIGDLTLQSGSIFETTITPTETSLVTVSGSVSISDSTYRLTVSPGIYLLSGTRVVLVGEGGITGEFTSILVNGSLPSSAFVNLTYTGTEVLLGFQPSLGLFAVGENAIEVAKTLDAASTELSEIYNSLIPLVTTKKRATYGLNQLHPAELKGLTISQENNAVRVRESITQRIMNELDSENCLSFHKKETQEKNHCDKNKKRMTAWISGLGDTLKQNNVTNSFGPLSGYRSNTGGIVTGIDALFADHFYAGAIGAYTNSHLHFQDGKGTGDISSGYAGVYLSVLGSGSIGKVFYANTSVIGSWSEYDVDRHIEYGKDLMKVNLIAKSDHGGNQILSHFDTGLNLNCFGVNIRPFDSFDYMSQTERGYAEHNAGQWDLTVTRKNAIMIRNELGLQFAKCLCLYSSKWIFSPKVSWVREVRIKGETFNVNFTGGGPSFVIHGYFPGRSLVAPGLAVTGYMLNDSLLFDLYYNGEFKGGYSSNSYGGQVGYSF